MGTRLTHGKIFAEFPKIEVCLARSETAAQAASSFGLTELTCYRRHGGLEVEHVKQERGKKRGYADA
ncbi:MAG: hypothetical protein DHS20C06_01170 [Hyphobacterium sp.]|nr:MAG: hypothetical protein DHS20C06_01170 [Hyphobacterium sp.]